MPNLKLIISNLFIDLANREVESNKLAYYKSEVIFENGIIINDLYNRI